MNTDEGFFITSTDCHNHHHQHHAQQLQLVVVCPELGMMGWVLKSECE